MKHKVSHHCLCGVYNNLIDYVFKLAINYLRRVTKLSLECNKKHAYLDFQIDLQLKKKLIPHILVRSLLFMMVIVAV